MQFRPYTHIEKYGEASVKNITIGDCYIFPKIDGSNGSIYMGDDNIIKAGGRKRELTLENDNKGFYAYVLENKSFELYLFSKPNHILYGEWLVPHTIRTYNKEAFNHFYVFDVYDTETNKYLSIDEYKKTLEYFNIKYIEPTIILSNGEKKDFINELRHTTFLNGDKAGEGIVIKNYDKQLVAKIVSSEFREQHEKTFYKKKEEPSTPLEQRIADYFTTTALCEKEYSKIENECGWSDKFQLRLLNVVYYNLIKEEGWEIVKKYKDPVIDYNKLKYYIFEVVKQKLPELFKNKN